MTKFCVIGLDGATWRILDPLIDSGKLPNLARLKKEGSSGALTSTIHPFSAQAWSSFMTGKNPGKHGVFDFFHHEENGYGLKFVNAGDRKGDTIWRILSNYGMNVGVVNVPLTYPPEKVNGFLIAGMDAPGKGSNFVYPPSLLKELESEVGPYVIEMSVRDYLRRGLEERFLDDLEQLTKQQVRFAKYLMRNKPWDFFVLVFRASDQVQHFFCRYMDPNHPYFVESSEKLKNGVVNIYRHLDMAIGQILNDVGPDSNVLIMSDHGHGPVGQRAIYINKWLESKGFLKFKNENTPGRAVCGMFGGQNASAAVDTLKKILPRKLKLFLLDRFPVLKDRVETMLSFSDIDFGNTIAYSEDLRANVWINLKGRQPKGVVGPENYHEVREGLIDLLEELRDPGTGQRIAAQVFRREDLYKGEFVSKAPDIVFVQPEDCYMYMLRRSRVGRGSSAWVETIAEPNLGVWPTSIHTLDGVFLLKGKNVYQDKWIEGARIIDVAPTILYLMGLPCPTDMDGDVIIDAIKPDFLTAHPPEKVSGDGEEAPGEVETPGYTEEEQAQIRERLKDLGYIE